MCWHATAVCTLVISFNIYCTQTYGLSLDQKGHQFMLSFIDPVTPDGELYLVINAYEEGTVHVSIPSLNHQFQNTLAELETWKFNISTKLRCREYFTPVKIAVSVISTGRVTVYVEDGTLTVASGYLALPYHGLSTSYIAVTYGAWDESANYPVFLIVATEDSTLVVIDYVVYGAGNCGGYYTGDRGTFPLNASDVYGVRCTDDFTGSRIGSDKPVAVISGHQGGQVKGLFRDVMQEMLLPVEHFGTSHVLLGHSGRGFGSVNRIVAASDDTTVTSSLGQIYHLNASTSIDIDTDEGGEQCITSDKPVFAVAISKSRRFFMDRFNAFMSIIPATTQFTRYTQTDFGLGSIKETTETAYVAIVVNGSEANFQSFPSGIRSNITNCDFIVVTGEVSMWPVYIEGDAVNVGLSVYVSYGQRQLHGVGFPLNIGFGINVTEFTQTTEETATPPPPTRVTKVPGSNSSLDESCDCPCYDHLPSNITPALIKLWEEEIQKRLLLDTGNLSKTVRKLTSAPDHRPSAVGIGTLGVCIFSFIGALIVLPDIGTCWNHFLRNRTPKGNVVTNKSE